MRKPFREQFIECRDSGLNTETEFLSFEDNPNLLPAFPNEKMIELIKNGEWTGVTLYKCGKFGGLCSSGNKECKKLRGIEND